MCGSASKWLSCGTQALLPCLCGLALAAHTAVCCRLSACVRSKSKAALKKMKFPPELDLPVDYDKVH